MLVRPENTEAPFTPLAKVGDILPGQGQAYAVSGRMVAVFNEDGKYFQRPAWEL